MKSHNFIIYIFLISSSYLLSKEGWYSVDVPTDTNINRIEFANKDFGIILTDRPELFLTLDGGNTFKNKSSNLYSSFNSKVIDIFIYRTNEIYLSQTNILLVSYDSCNTWYMLNNIDSNNIKITCEQIYKYENHCYCKTKLDLYHSLDSMKNWKNIENALTYSRARSWRRIKFSKNNFLIFCTSDVMSNYQCYIKYYLGLDSLKVIDLNEYIPFAVNYEYDTKTTTDTSISISYLNNIGSCILQTTDNGGFWQNIYCVNQNNQRINGRSLLTPLESNYIYLYNEDIFLYKDSNMIKCKVANKQSKSISNIIAINRNVSYAQILNVKYTFNNEPINYFLKTEDGGGVDMSDVEEVIPQDEITQSTHIELYDILGRSIATFPSYDKLKAEIENYPPPHLIKWLDEKGIFHFERMK